ncbi:putative chlorophyll(ide) b reductase [Lupinus albus]|uniref:chlorophyll(ide) b reductase n=1 Tax=Lupinus albus TaxID=3870 RepID=A0A6A4NFD4_LUPAL|nr:putative chlorophyll(ide) b reductase [Lupinus albus]
MATVVKLHVFPESFNQHRTRLLRSSFFGPSNNSSSPRVLGFGHNYEGLSVKQCRAFRSEDGGDLKEKKIRTLKKNEVNPKRESGFWNSLKYILLGSKSDDVYRHAVVKVEEVLSVIAIQIGRYIVTMMSTGVILAIGFQMSGGDSQMDALIWYSWLGGIIIGTMIGSNMVLEEHCRAGPRNVVITGSTRGLGKALAREFLLSGDRVVVTSRSPESVEATIKELEENLKEGINNAVGPSLTKLSHAKVVGIASDVCEPHDVKRLANFAVNELGHIDIWINNAGTNKGFRPLLQFSDEDIKQIVSTNLVGSILCTREAMHIMRNQAKAGHIFNMDGNGSGGSSTPLTAVYGSTKCGLRQLQGSLLKECKRTIVGIHTASPGMVLTDLLLSGSTVQNRQMFNIICELPETVARTLVPRMRVVKGTGKAICYLTPPRILLALVTAWLRRGRWFDDKGRALYAAEADRLRNWAENRARFSFTDAMEMYTENTWLSVFSLSVVCAFIILSSTGNTNLPGTW